MIQEKQTVYTTDEQNNKVKVVREFDAPVEKVWKAWTDRSILDQWWAPKPWKTVSKSQDFKEGGTWLYYMEGPEGEKHHCRADYKKIVPGKSFEVRDYFTDEQGNPNGDFPGMNWVISFNETSDNSTKAQCDLGFKSAEDLKTIMNMGFKEGFEAAHGNLDELLAK
ncbi:MAG TPA: SRPBCC domain-containing protein [Chitinophagaceae bacterium]|nr:SRPBCC domain-containing protein [Chitinophagaceae bacterium]